ncbi:hypothetical protein B0H11DRAFT_2375367 [Mycena galericulata]|nr:hypothetical protein B0H11DRAFT_2375367 [Mycena galericulata]
MPGQVVAQLWARVRRDPRASVRQPHVRYVRCTRWVRCGRTEYRIFAADSLVAMPAAPPFVRPLALPFHRYPRPSSSALTAYNALSSGCRPLIIKAGDTVLMQGTGGVTTTPNWDEEVVKLTNGAGAVLMLLGILLKKSLAVVKRAGTLDLIGRDVPAPDIITPCILKEVGRLVRVCGGTVGGHEQTYVCECADYAAGYQ